LSIKKGETTTSVNAEDTCLAEIGIYRTPDEFQQVAADLQHPFDGASTVPDDLKRAMFWLLTQGVHVVQQERVKLFEHYKMAADNLAEDEAALHSLIDADREALIRDKKILLFQLMCRDAGVDDEGLGDLIASGVKLTGQGEYSRQFEEELKPPAISNVDLMRSSKWTRRKILGRSNLHVPDNVREQVWQGALDEAQKGWLTGPLTELELRGQLGPMFVVSRRFGLEQADKVRAIDDMSESLVNSAYGSSYKLDLPGIDGISTAARTWLESISDDRGVQFTLSDGTVLKGRLHHSLTLSDARSLRGRTLDLDAAYKQLLTAKSSLWCAVLAVEDLQGCKRLFKSNVIPFGASASVYGFNKLARAIYTIGVRLFGLVWNNYYDDYPQLDIAASGDDAQVTAEALFDLLGWRVSMKESKRVPMSDTFEALGVTFDFTASEDGVVMVRNKPSRILQICSELDRILHSGCLSISEATSLRGKLQFAETHTFGRVLASHLQMFHKRASGQLSDSVISETMRHELLWIRDFMTEDIPRKLLSGMADYKLCIFTDASLEGSDSHAGVGMVALCVCGGQIQQKFFFSDVVPAWILSLLQCRTPKIISTLELLSAVMAIHLLEDKFQNIRVMLFVDNEAARASLISLKSSLEIHQCLLRNVSLAVRRSGLYLWTARVPSSSNPSDEPSRELVDKLLNAGFCRLSVSWNLAHVLTSEKKCICLLLMLIPVCSRCACPRGDKPMHIHVDALVVMYHMNHMFGFTCAYVDGCEREEMRRGPPQLFKKDWPQVQDFSETSWHVNEINKNRLTTCCHPSLFRE
jgi:hypothetical protein